MSPIRSIKPPPSSTLRYWNLARQRHCRPSAPYHRATPVSPDRAACSAPLTGGKARLFDVRGQNSARHRLSAGGRRIRTIGPSCKKRVVLVETRRLLKGADDRDPSKLQPFSRGTGSSNPSPSSGESANLRSLSAPVSGNSGAATKSLSPLSGCIFVEAGRQTGPRWFT